VHTKQAEALRSTAHLTGFCAGRGCGKTTVGPYWIWMQAYDGDEFMAASPTYPMMEETTFPVFLRVMREMDCYVRSTRSPFRIWFRTQDGGTAVCVFRSADNPDSLRGPSKKGLWLDETTYMPATVTETAMAILRFKGDLGRCFMTFTPRGRRHWTFGQFFDRYEGTEAQRLSLLQEVESRKSARTRVEAEELAAASKRLEAFKAGKDLPKPDTKFIQATTLDNVFQTAAYDAKMRGNYTAQMARQELGGELIDIDGKLFSQHFFRYCDHVEIPLGCIRLRYWDLANTEDGGCNTAGVLLAYDTKNDQAYIEDVRSFQHSSLMRNEEILMAA
jgi:phage terminase large subunit-like protein